MDRLFSKFRGARNLVYSWLQPETFSVRSASYMGCSFLLPLHKAIGWRLYKDKTYEELELSCLKNICLESDTIIDIGANIGIFSVILAKVASKGRLIAIEPVASNRCLLQANLCINGIANASVLDTIVSDKAGMVDFAVAEDEAYSSIRETGRNPTKEIIRVKAVSLDDLFPAESVDVIKLDVEGAEMMVLRGGEKLFSSPERRPRAILVELNAQNQAVYGYGPEDIILYMRSFDYEVYSLTPRKLVRGFLADPDHEDVLFWDAAKPLPGHLTS